MQREKLDHGKPVMEGERREVTRKQVLKALMEN